MRSKKIISYVWLLLAAVCTVEIYLAWTKGEFNTRFYALVFGFVVSIFMFNFRKREARKMEARRREKNINQSDT